MAVSKFVWVVGSHRTLYLDAQPLLAARQIMLRLIDLLPDSLPLKDKHPDLVIIGSNQQESVDAVLSRLQPDQIVWEDSFRDATELITRLEALFSPPEQPAKFQIDLDPKHATIMLNGTVIRLTPREFDIFSHLYRAPEYTMARKDFFRRIWGGLKVCNKVLDVHVSNLRKKIQAHGLRIQFTKPDSLVMTLPAPAADSDDPAPAGDGPEMLLMAATGV